MLVYVFFQTATIKQQKVKLVTNRLFYCDNIGCGQLREGGREKGGMNLIAIKLYPGI